MLPIGPVIDRLADQVPALKWVAGLAAYAALPAVPATQLPAAFVIPGRVRPEPMPGPAAVQAFRRESFTVDVMVENVRDVRGEVATAQMLALADAVCVALVDWQPSDDRKPVQFAGAELIGFTDLRLEWAVHFETRRVLLDTGVSYELG